MMQLSYEKRMLLSKTQELERLWLLTQAEQRAMHSRTWNPQRWLLCQKLSGSESAILNSESGDSESCDAKVRVKVASNLDRLLRESETTIKIEFALFRGGWAGGQGGKLSKTIFFVGSATTIKF